MQFLFHNIWPILLSTIGGMLLGFLRLWYARMLTPRILQDKLILGTLVHVWISCSMAGIMLSLTRGIVHLDSSLLIASIIWAGILAPILLLTGRQRRVPMQIILQDGLFWLICLWLQTLMLAAGGLRLPG